MTKNNKKEIQELLQLVANGLGKRLTDKNGNLDIEAFNNQKSVKLIIEKLKSLGIKSNEDLFKMGFVAAGMVLKIN